MIDVGAGTGKLTAPLAERGAEVLAVEPVAEMRARIAERTARATAVAGVAERPARRRRVGGRDRRRAGIPLVRHRRRAGRVRPLPAAGGAPRADLEPPGADDELQTRITALLEPLRGDAPRHAVGAWREVFEHPGPFEQRRRLRARVHPGARPRRPLDRVGSISFVAALEPQPRAELLARVGELCLDGAIVELPYVCEASSTGGPAGR